MRRTFINLQRRTAKNFALPESQPFITLRTSFRYGGKEPVLGPRLAMEIRCPASRTSETFVSYDVVELENFCPEGRKFSGILQQRVP
jgi:hypothetical protein